MSGQTHRRARRNTTLVAGTVFAVAGITTYATQVAAHESGSAGEGDRWTGVYALTDDEIAAIQATIEPFADPAAAEAAGRVNLDLCFDMMGDHYADPATFGDGVLDAADPEALVYADVGGARNWWPSSGSRRHPVQCSASLCTSTTTSTCGSSTPGSASTTRPECSPTTTPKSVPARHSATNWAANSSFRDLGGQTRTSPSSSAAQIGLTPAVSTTTVRPRSRSTPQPTSAAVSTSST